jgi:hypothetical protein
MNRVAFFRYSRDILTRRHDDIGRWNELEAKQVAFPVVSRENRSAAV